eukprot:TRINITY_DN19835_c0_g1_i1.p1 TRINITY_DN19835_c0_g1~~TRINITY_DN19835_c0_g1_i1.p1  ORF type:complete len:351 (+),score=73.13 TRINITY_DN19835_c0_g1_i1:40-1053(+)
MPFPWRTVAQVLFLVVVVQNVYFASKLHGGAEVRAAPPTVLGCRLKDPLTGDLLEAGGAFRRVGLKVPHTDRFNHAHHYEALYAKYLDPLAAAGSAGVRLLELGLGCKRRGGPGGEVELWRRLFGPTLQYVVMEEARACEEAWRRAITQLPLSPADREWYESAHARAVWGVAAGSEAAAAQARAKVPGGAFDVMVDPGGRPHDRTIAAFERLFPLLAPGGVYFLENLESSFHPSTASPDEMLEQQTTVGYLQRLVTDLHYRPDTTASRLPRQLAERTVHASLWVRSLDCDRGICAVVKRHGAWAPDLEAHPGVFQWPCDWQCDWDGACRCQWGAASQ